MLIGQAWREHNIFLTFLVYNRWKNINSLKVFCRWKIVDINVSDNEKNSGLKKSHNLKVLIKNQVNSS